MAASVEEVNEESKTVALQDQGIEALRGVKWHLWGSVRVIDLSKNKLREIPMELWRMENVISLNLQFNQIETVPPISLCRSMLVDLTGNMLSHLAVGESKERAALVSLNVSRNKLRTIEENLGLAVPTLQNLFLEGNELEKLPESILNLVVQHPIFYHNICFHVTDTSSHLAVTSVTSVTPISIVSRYSCTNIMYFTYCVLGLFK